MVVLALPWIFIQKCRRKIPYYFFTPEITVGHFQIVIKQSVGKWELVWPALIRQNSVHVEHVGRAAMVESEVAIVLEMLAPFPHACLLVRFVASLRRKNCCASFLPSSTLTIIIGEELHKTLDTGGARIWCDGRAHAGPQAWRRSGSLHHRWLTQFTPSKFSPISSRNRAMKIWDSDLLVLE